MIEAVEMTKRYRRTNAQIAADKAAKVIRPFTSPAPAVWTAEHVADRLADAFRIMLMIPQIAGDGQESPADMIGDLHIWHGIQGDMRRLRATRGPRQPGNNWTAVGERGPAKETFEIWLKAADYKFKDIVPPQQCVRGSMNTWRQKNRHRKHQTREK